MAKRMSKQMFIQGAKFSFEGGFGIVLSETHVLIIASETPPHPMQLGGIPGDDFPCFDDVSKMPEDVSLALGAVALAIILIE